MHPVGLRHISNQSADFKKNIWWSATTRIFLTHLLAVFKFTTGAFQQVSWVTSWGLGNNIFVCFSILHLFVEAVLLEPCGWYVWRFKPKSLATSSYYSVISFFSALPRNAPPMEQVIVREYLGSHWFHAAWGFPSKADHLYLHLRLNCGM